MMKASIPLVNDADLAEISDSYARSIMQNSSPSMPEIAFLKRLNQTPSIIRARSNKMAYTLRMLDCVGRGPLIDIGAGAGLNAVLAIYNGAKVVHAVEYEEERFESARLLVENLKLEDRVILHKESILDVELSSGEYVGAYSFELLEHISDLSELHKRVYCWLKKGSRIYGRSGANGLSILRILQFLREYRTIEIRPSSRYYQRRYAFIKEHAPAMAEQKLTKLTLNTQGMLFSEVQSALEAFLKTGKMPPYNPLRAPRDPQTREYMERLLRAFQLRRIIDAEGFRTKILRPFYGALTVQNPLKKRAALAVGSILRLTHPLSLLVAPWIEVLSEKTDE